MWLSHKEIGKLVLAIRNGLPGRPSQAAMAKLLNRPESGSTIGSVERGVLWGEDQEPDVRLLLDIATLGGRDLDHFRVGNVVNPDVKEKMIVIDWLTNTAEDLRAQVKRITEEQAKALNVPGAETLHGMKKAIRSRRPKGDNSNERKQREGP